MACSRCEERRKALAAGVSSAVRGDVRAAVSSAAYVGRTLAQDVRSGALQRAAASNLTQLRAAITKRR